MIPKLVWTRSSFFPIPPFHQGHISEGSIFSKAFKKKCVSDVVRIASMIIFDLGML